MDEFQGCLDSLQSPGGKRCFCFRALAFPFGDPHGLNGEVFGTFGLGVGALVQMAGAVGALGGMVKPGHGGPVGATVSTAISILG